MILSILYHTRFTNLNIKKQHASRFSGGLPAHIVGLFVILSIVSIPGMVHSQLAFIDEKTVETQRNARDLAAIENLEGNVVIAGTCDTKEKGTDVVVQIVDKNGGLVSNYLFGGLKDDGAHSIIETRDGGYILAGYTNSKWPGSKGDRDALLLKISRQGQPQWYHITGTIGNDEWRQVISAPSGDLIVGGFYGSHPALMSITASGEITWEKNLVQLNAQINTLGLNGQSVFFAGKSGQEPQTKMFIGSCHLAGIVSLTKTFDSFLEGVSLIINNEGEIIIAGNSSTKSNRIDGVILKLNSNLDILTQRLFGSFSDEEVNSVIELPDHNYLIVGNSFSASKGARRPDLWIELLKPDFTPVTLPDNYYGDSQEDLGFSALALTTNNVWVIGSSHTGMATSANTWILNFDLPVSQTYAEPDAFILSDIDSIWISGEDKILDPQEYGYYSLRVKNNSALPSKPSRIVLKSSETLLSVPDSLIIHQIPPGDTRVIDIPFSIDEDIPEDSILLTIGGLIQKYSFSIPVRQTFVPKIHLTDFFFQENEIKDEIILNLKLSNSGNGYLSQSTVYLNTSFKVEALSANQIAIHNFAPGRDTTIRFAFRPLTNYNEDSVAIDFVLRSNEASILLQKEVSYLVQQPTDTGKEKNSGVAELKEHSEKNIIFHTAVWMRPDPIDKGYKIDHLTSEIDIRLKIISTIPIHPDSIYLSINNQTATPGIAFLPNSLVFNTETQQSGYQYTYSNTINLVLGENIIQLIHKGTREPLTADPLVIDYIPKRYNLHVYAIGIPQEDLKFTAKDAKDFAAAFEGQSGKLFQEVKVNLYNTPETTTTPALRFAIQDIANDYFIREKINQGDMVLIYMSSHGFQIDEQKDKFKIAASDFDWLYKSQTSLDFKEDVMDVLSSIQCKKLLLLDACYSGAIADIIKESGQKSSIDPGEIGLSKAIARLMESQNDLQVITSSSPGQRSYEDESWGNSAFMKGLLEAIGKSSDSNLKAKVDTDADHILYVSEIFNFIKNRIPEIVLTKKPRPSDLQSPWMMASEEWPVFVY